MIKGSEPIHYIHWNDATMTLRRLKSNLRFPIKPKCKLILMLHWLHVPFVIANYPTKYIIQRMLIHVSLRIVLPLRAWPNVSAFSETKNMKLYSTLYDSNFGERRGTQGYYEVNGTAVTRFTFFFQARFHHSGFLLYPGFLQKKYSSISHPVLRLYRA